jgi:hypothetical protein
MLHKFENEFYQICEEIILENKSISQWAAIESDDMFQSGKYEGGFDATGMEFCFSVFVNNVEYWFQLSLDSIQEINKKNITEVQISKADW